MDRGTVVGAGEGETLIKSLRLNGIFPGVGGACKDADMLDRSTALEGDGGDGNSCEDGGTCDSGVGGITVVSSDAVETAALTLSLDVSRRNGWLN